MAVQRGQRGYDGLSRSIRATNAEASGRRPFSRITAADLRAAKILIPRAIIAWAISERIITTDEWHHTGKYARATDYFDVNDIARQIREMGPNELTTRYEKRSTTPDEGRRVTVTYKTAIRDGRYVRTVRRTEDGTLRGAWIHLDSGTRKQARGTGIERITLHVGAA